MTSYDAFVVTYKEFLNELAKTIPEEESLKSELETIEDESGEIIVKKFLKMVPDSSKVVQRDETFFQNEDSMFSIHKYYKEFSTNTKDALWQYLNTLYVLATTINNIPPELLGAIENVAQKCAGDMEGSNEMPDMANLFAGMQNMLQGMMKKK